MAGVGPLVTFVVALVVGGFGIYAAARFIAGARSYEYAVATGLFGAIVWGVVVLLLGKSSWIATVVPLLAWVVVIEWRYRESWLRAAMIGVIAWAMSVVVLATLSLLGLEAARLPFT